MSIRPVKRLIQSKPALEGAGVHLRRAFGYGIRFPLVSGKPLEEPVAWYGLIVMNTQEQLRQAFTELQEGTFLKETRHK
jgi:redox-sensitive bicupin YhaK (pirin superfamily)